MTKAKTPIDEMNFNRRHELEYGFMWWLWPEDAPEGFNGAYTAKGMYGQFITVMPELDMVVAHKTNDIYGRTTEWRSYLKLLKVLAEAKK